MAMTRPALTAVFRRFLVPRTTRSISATVSGDIGLELRAMQKPTNMQRKILVWGRVFRTAQEVPDRVSALQMKKAYDVFRIQICMVMFVAGVLASIGVIFNGRQQLKARRRLYDPNSH